VVEKGADLIKSYFLLNVAYQNDRTDNRLGFYKHGIVKNILKFETSVAKFVCFVFVYSKRDEPLIQCTAC
jgi:hypothetical protein